MTDAAASSLLWEGRSREEQFLLRTLRSFVLQGDGREAPEQPPGLQWDRVAQLVHVNNIGPVVHHCFREHPLPLRDHGRWGQVRMKQLVDNLRTLRVAVRLFRLFEDAGIRSVGLRGVTLAHLHYPDAGLRPMKDLDLLVDARDHGQVIEALRRDGLEPSNRLRSQVVYVIDGIEVEVHLSLLTAKRYRAVFDRDALLAARTGAKTAEGAVFRLTREDELLELVAHAFVHHELQGLGRMLDIALVMTRPGLEWDRIVRWCEASRLTNMVLFTLAFTDSLFGLDLRPEERFGRKLPFWSHAMFRSYLKLYFGGDNPMDYLCRMRSLLYAAERPVTKMNQLFRFFSKRYAKDLRYLLRKDKAPHITA